MKRELMHYQKRYEHVFQATPSQLLLEEPADEDSEHEDLSYNLSHFEFDEDGIVM